MMDLASDTLIPPEGLLSPEDSDSYNNYLNSETLLRIIDSNASGGLVRARNLIERALRNLPIQKPDNGLAYIHATDGMERARTLNRLLLKLDKVIDGAARNLDAVRGDSGSDQVYSMVQYDDGGRHTVAIVGPGDLVYSEVASDSVGGEHHPASIDTILNRDEAPAGPTPLRDILPEGSA